MNNIRTLVHLRTPRMIKGFRACVNMTGRSQILAEQGRLYAEEYRRLNCVQQVKNKVILRGLS